jgi:hypothetical protein
MAILYMNHKITKYFIAAFLLVFYSCSKSDLNMNNIPNYVEKTCDKICNIEDPRGIGEKAVLDFDDQGFVNGIGTYSGSPLQKNQRLVNTYGAECIIYAKKGNLFILPFYPADAIRRCFKTGGVGML